MNLRVLRITIAIAFLLMMSTQHYYVSAARLSVFIPVCSENSAYDSASKTCRKMQGKNNDDYSYDEPASTQLSEKTQNKQEQLHK